MINYNKIGSLTFEARDIWSPHGGYSKYKIIRQQSMDDNLAIISYTNRVNQNSSTQMVAYTPPS